LAAALLTRSRAAKNIGLILIVLCAASAWPVLIYGQHGYNHLYPQIDTESQQWLDAHMERAERFVYAFYLTAVLGVGALLIQNKFRRTMRALTGLTLAAAIASLGIGGWISRAGGEVSHSEFRGDEAPPITPGREHDMAGASHDEMRMSDMNGSHQHTPAARSSTGKTPTPGREHDMAGASNDEMRMPDMDGARQHTAAAGRSTGKTPTPDTPEGLWEEIHRHQSELEAAVTAKKLGEVHPGAEAIRGLATALVDVAHPDHKAAVRSGVGKVSKELDALSHAAESGDQTAAETNFKQFDDALRHLEEQMKKQ
jgi:hypothetical protein